MKFNEVNACEACATNKLFIPASKDDLNKVKLTKRTSKLDQPTRIWTDYQRINETFFWSATALQCWTCENEHRSRLSQLNF